jgi:hypothetical protein
MRHRFGASLPRRLTVQAPSLGAFALVARRSPASVPASEWRRGYRIATEEDRTFDRVVADSGSGRGKGIR